MGKKKGNQRQFVLAWVAESEMLGNLKTFPGQTLSDKMQIYYEGQILSALSLSDVGDRYLELMRLKEGVQTHLKNLKDAISKKHSLQNWAFGGGGLAAGAGVGIATSLLFPIVFPAIILGIATFGITAAAGGGTEDTRRHNIKEKFKAEKAMLKFMLSEVEKDLKQIRTSVSDEALMSSARVDTLRQIPALSKRLNRAFIEAMKNKKDGKNGLGGNGQKPPSL